MGRAPFGSTSQPGWFTLKRVLLTITLFAAAAGLLAAVTPEPPAVERLPALGVDEPAFAVTLEGHLATPIVDGNRVDVLLNGDEIFPAKLAAIRAARTSINYAQYFWAEGDVAQQLAEALAERCRAGVARQRAARRRRHPGHAG